MTTYVSGSAVTLEVTFTDGSTSSLAIDPASVTVTTREPNGGATTPYNYGSSAMVRDGAGTYRISVIATTPGRWLWEWEGGGATPIVVKGEFFVEPRI